jgi:hypothetical protein
MKRACSLLYALYFYVSILYCAHKDINEMYFKSLIVNEF